MENERIEKYKLVGIKEHTSKTGNKYHIAYILFENNYSFDILNVLINNKQVGALTQVVNDETFEIERFLKTTYNSYSKQYQLTINYGL